MINGNFAVAQSGGPTAAINASLCGVIRAALTENRKVYGMINGVRGAIDGNFVDLGENFRESRNLSLLKTTPAAYLGSCRYRLPDFDGENDIYEKIFDNFEKRNIKMVIYIGGNDSMDTVMRLSEYAEKNGKSVHFAGVPKTIDNDLMGTDHTPGFGSAAKFVATAVSEIARDCAVYADRSATVVEIMGRNAGWLTAASALSRSSTSAAPHLIYLPERPLSQEKLIEDIKKCTERNMVIAVSEGIKNEKGVYYSNLDCNSVHDKFGHAQLCGSAKVVEGIIKETFGIKTRSVELNVLQRCSSHFASLTDLNEAEEIGMFGVKALLSGNTAVTAGFKRIGDYAVGFVLNDVKDVANLEKTVPDEFIAPSGNDVTQSAIEYLRPLILGEPKIETENGIPRHIVL
ncbi:MAG: 6-phosphofructokinase [Clostridia bacterium]|nr:6-phosphofructokinase [Clostridia bacterium]